MSETLSTRCRQLLLELDIISPDESIEAVPLTGGVASDIAMVKTNTAKLCVKFALPKLKVQADWFAPVHRNAAEYAWLEVAAGVAPEGAVALYGQSEKLHGFAMEYLDGDDTYLWKTRLLDEAPDHSEAAHVGDLLGRIHAESAVAGFDQHLFQNQADFHALRLEPYLLYTASKHGNIGDKLEKLTEELHASNQVLVHGDVSPKNILIRAKHPILLDAECATMGDASFDPSFCLNHLVLKAIHLPESKSRYLANALSFWKSYSPSVTWENSESLEARICRLLPALMLARVDGKSPVEYLSNSSRQTVRRIATYFIQSPVIHLEDLLSGINEQSQETGA